MCTVRVNWSKGFINDNVIHQCFIKLKPFAMQTRLSPHRLSNVDIRLLKVFRTVAECGGFAASEFELNVGRSTISRHISDLETRVGMKLCLRGPGGFALTREGEMVLEASNRLIDALNIFQGDVDDIHSNLRGTLRIAFFDLAARNPEAALSNAIASFAEQAGNVSLELSTEPPNVIEAGVVSGRFDIGVVPLHQRSDGLIFHPLYRETMVLYCGKGHPLYNCRGTGDLGKENSEKNVDVEQLFNFKFAGFGFSSPNMTSRQKLGLKLSSRVHNEEALMVLLLSGHYIGFLPDHVAKPFVESGQLAALLQAQTSYQTRLGAIVRKHSDLGRKTDLFLKCLLETHSANVPSGLSV